MDVWKFNSAKALSEAMKKEEAKDRIVVETKKEEIRHREKELALSKEGNQYALEANKIAVDSNKIANESNQISRRSNILAWIAIAISVVSLLVTFIN